VYVGVPVVAQGLAVPFVPGAKAMPTVPVPMAPTSSSSGCAVSPDGAVAGDVPKPVLVACWSTVPLARRPENSAALASALVTLPPPKLTVMVDPAGRVATLCAQQMTVMTSSLAAWRLVAYVLPAVSEHATGRVVFVPALL
jgi:hypothetical protein